jgi:hypothetical protein
VQASPVLFPRRSRRRLGRLIRLPRPRWLLRYFVLQHIQRRLAEIERRFSALAAFAADRSVHARELEMLQDFRRSLPTRTSRKLLILLAVMGVLLAVRVLTLSADRQVEENRRALKLLIELENSLLSLNVQGGFLETLYTTPLTTILQLLLVFIICTYLVLRLGYPGFRLKRALFSIYAGCPAELGSASLREHVTAAGGLYRVEAEALLALGVRAQREFPFDLALSALAAGLWTAFGLLTLSDGDKMFSVAFFIGPGVLRLGWLGYALRRRLRYQPLPGKPLAEGASARGSRDGDNLAAALPAGPANTE